MKTDMGGLVYGQQVYFLGYPFGWDSGGEQINRGVPLPFVKGGIVSAMEVGDVSRIFLDAHVNEGFSGGPVVFVPNGHPIGSNTKFKVAGIVVSYPTPHIQPVVDQQRNPIGNIGILENPGFVVAIGIDHATTLIDSNPIGFSLTNG